MTARALPLWALLLAWAGPAAAQLISIRTVPISQSHQFDFLPSISRAMGGVTIASGDSLLDPFGNPAYGARLHAARFFSSPGVYGVSRDAGAGRTLPLGALGRSGAWYWGVTVAAQQVDLSDLTGPGPLPLTSCPNCETVGLDLSTDDRTHGNSYASAIVGRAFPTLGLSVGGSVSWAGLHAVDGVDLLYANSARVRQRGHALDLRLGGLKEWDGEHSLAAVLVHHRYASTHDVFYLDGIWDPGGPGFGFRPRVEQNLDHTNTWGLHLEYQQPLRAEGWRLGWLATTNLASHPKIPNYELQNIPRDPGHSTAFNLGVGIDHAGQGARFGADLVYEPIWSYTWADAAGPVSTTTGGTIPAGGKTIENWFRFSNAVLRMGFSQDLPLEKTLRAMGVQLGLDVHRIHYSMEQRNNVQSSTRHLREGWMEWSPTWGLSFRFPTVEVRYRGSVTNGTGRPGVGRPDVFAETDLASGPILVAPSGPVSIGSVKVTTHQVSLSLPLR